MGYCHKCEHDCTEKDPCPCCRKDKCKYTPWYPTDPIYPTIPWPDHPFSPRGPKYSPYYYRITTTGGSPDCTPKNPAGTRITRMK